MRDAVILWQGFLYLADVPQPGNQLEIRGPIGGYFTWDVTEGGPTQLVEAVATKLTDHGHDPMHIKTERFGPTDG